MRIGLAAYLLHGGADYRAAGVSLYTQRLLEQLPVSRPDNEYVSFQGKNAPVLPGIQRVLSPIPTRQPAVRIAWEQTGLPLQALRERVDLMHGTVNALPLAWRKAAVVTVHDLSFMRFPDQFPRGKAAYLRAAVRLSVRKAERVIAVSENTRRDLIEMLGTPPERVAVVYSGASESFRPLPDEDVRRFRDTRFAGRPFLLHVGTLQPRKNIDVLIRAYAELRRSGEIPHVLALVGARGWMYDDLFSLVASERLEEHVHFVDYVGHDELPLWYNACDLFAYPSAYEGFGLPVLEAMACGAPIITSASSALEELAGDACLTVPPGSQEALHLALKRVLADAALRCELRRRGVIRASSFTWDRTARETAKVYEHALGATSR